jgi:hypothetical protein
MRRLVITLVTLVVGVVFVAAVGITVTKANAENQLTVQPALSLGTVDTANGKLPHVVLELSAWPDSRSGCHGQDGGAHPDWVTFCNTTSLSVPAHALVTVRVHQYDAGEKITNAYFAKVHGTADGMAVLNGKSFNEIPPDQVGHTWTLRGIPSPNQDSLFVSVPLQMADEEKVGDNGYPVPNVVEFSFYTGGPGKYFWNCEFPCGDGTYAKFGAAMSKYGYMSGKVSVVEHI